MQSRNEFLELAAIDTVHGGTSLYGVSYAAVRSVAAGGKVCLIAMDVQGGRTLFQDSRIEAAFVYVAPPSVPVLRQRLQLRLREHGTTVQKRLEWAKQQVCLT